MRKGALVCPVARRGGREAAARRGREGIALAHGLLELRAVAHLRQCSGNGNVRWTFKYDGTGARLWTLSGERCTRAWEAGLARSRSKAFLQHCLARIHKSYDRIRSDACHRGLPEHENARRTTQQAQCSTVRASCKHSRQASAGEPPAPRYATHCIRFLLPKRALILGPPLRGG